MNEITNTMNRHATASRVQSGPCLPSGVFRPSLAFYHANARGTGSALKLELHPAHDDTEGSIMATFAPQATIGGGRGNERTFSTFNWEGAVCVKLGFEDLCKILQVFRGETETINEGKGLYHRSPTGSVKIQLVHCLEEVTGYSFSVSKTLSDASERDIRIFFAPWEALGLCESIANSLGVICFGIPMVIPHDTSAYRAKVKEVRNGVAA